MGWWECNLREWGYRRRRKGGDGGGEREGENSGG